MRNARKMVEFYHFLITERIGRVPLGDLNTRGLSGAIKRRETQDRFFGVSAAVRPSRAKVRVRSMVDSETSSASLICFA